MKQSTQHFKLRKEARHGCSFLLIKNIWQDILQPNVSGFLIKHSCFTVGVYPNHKWDHCGSEIERVEIMCNSSNATCRKKSNHIISSADEKKVGAQPACTCWWIWTRMKTTGLYWSPTAPRGQTHTYAEYHWEMEREEERWADKRKKYYKDGRWEIQVKEIVKTQKRIFASYKL